jgi:hypothetical protein
VLIVGSFGCCVGLSRFEIRKLIFLEISDCRACNFGLKITQILRRENAAITLAETEMRSIISIQARICLRSTVRGRYGIPCSAVRWSSTEARQWSTPLAKQLHEAITVYFPSSNHSIKDG